MASNLRRQLLALLGPPGSGKSTLVRKLRQLADPEPTGMWAAVVADGDDYGYHPVDAPSDWIIPPESLLLHKARSAGRSSLICAACSNMEEWAERARQLGFQVLGLMPPLELHKQRLRQRMHLEPHRRDWDEELLESVADTRSYFLEYYRSTGVEVLAQKDATLDLAAGLSIQPVKEQT